MAAPAPLEIEAQVPNSAKDADGIDRTLIRDMLALEPAERLQRVESMVQDILEIWELNGTRPVR
jgi:hypothetical protein